MRVIEGSKTLVECCASSLRVSFAVCARRVIVVIARDVGCQVGSRVPFTALQPQRRK